MSKIIIRYHFYILLLLSLTLFYQRQMLSQLKWKELSEGIESTDSIIVYKNDTLTIELIKNHWLGIKIQAGDEDATDWNSKNSSKTGWKTFKSNQLGLTFDYPPEYKIRKRLNEKDTSIEIYGHNKLSDYMMSIKFTDNTFDVAAKNSGFSQEEGLWFADGVSPMRATYIMGERWSALEGENTYMTPVDGGGMASTADIIFIALKDLSPYRSVILDKPNEMSCADFVAIILSLKYTNSANDLNSSTNPRNQWHPSISNWKENVLIGRTNKLTIRVDRTDKGLRYVSWSKGHSKSEKPDLILFNGTEMQLNNGSSCTFVNDKWTYIIEDVNKSDNPNQQGLFLRLLLNGTEKSVIKLEKIKYLDMRAP